MTTVPLEGCSTPNMKLVFTVPINVCLNVALLIGQSYPALREINLPRLVFNYFKSELQSTTMPLCRDPQRPKSPCIKSRSETLNNAK